MSTSTLGSGPKGEVLAIRPRFLLVPPEAEQSARQLIADIQPDQAANVNPWADVFDVLVALGLSDPNRWYVIGDPATSDGRAHAYLDGQEGPRVDQKEGWETVGIFSACRWPSAPAPSTGATSAPTTARPDMSH